MVGGTMMRTERLELVPLELARARYLLSTGLPGDRRGAIGYPTDGSLVAAGMVVRAEEEGLDPGPFTTYQVLRREDGEVLGDCGFHGPPDSDGTVQVGYGIAESVRGRGYASEAVAALVAFGLQQPGVSRVMAETTRSDPASRRVLEKAGLRLVGLDGELLVFAST